jgi:hypothetical protein
VREQEEEDEGDGTVFDELGKPMPGVPVMAWEVRTALSGERTLDFPTNFGEAVTTDDRGMYRIFGLAPGEYTVGTSWSYRGMNGDVRIPTDAEYREAFRAVAEPASSAASVQTTALKLRSPITNSRFACKPPCPSCSTPAAKRKRRTDCTASTTKRHANMAHRV